MFVTPFSRFRSQPSGNTGGQHDTLKTVMSWCKPEKACRVKLQQHGYFIHTLYDLSGVEVFFKLWGPGALEMLHALRYLNPALTGGVWYYHKNQHGKNMPCVFCRRKLVTSISTNQTCSPGPSFRCRSIPAMFPVIGSWGSLAHWIWPRHLIKHIICLFAPQPLVVFF